MTVKCPCCQQSVELKKPALVSLNTNTAVFDNGVSVKLAPGVIEVLYAIVEHYPLPISRVTLHERMYGLNAEYKTKSMDVQIMNLRNHLPEGYVIETVLRRGYKLVRISGASRVNRRFIRRAKDEGEACQRHQNE